MPVDPIYLPLAPGHPAPDFHSAQRYRAVVIVECDVTHDWRNAISDWLVATGCLYMLAWGRECSMWDDSVDWSNMAEWRYADIPVDRFVMTTWHEKESFAQMLYFAKYLAIHPEVRLERTIILHISGTSKELEILDAWNNA